MLKYIKYSYLLILFVFYIHIFRFLKIIFIVLHGSTFLSILDAIWDFPGNNKKASFLVSCITSWCQKYADKMI